MKLKKIKYWFENGNVMVTGEKGSGKDVLTGNVIARMKGRYVSNMDYTKDNRYIPLDLSKLDVGKNYYKNFISGNVNKYIYPYEDGCHIFISDAGNYFPAQYTGQLDRDYPYLPTLFSLIRQLGDCQIHTNAQAYERVWNKLREQSSDKFIRCDKCHVFLGYQGRFARKFEKIFKIKWKFSGIVFATFYFYDKASSCQDRVKPCRIRMPLFADKNMRLQVKMYRDKFYNTYGTVTKEFYICLNRSKHDSRLFKTILENGA